MNIWNLHLHNEPFNLFKQGLKKVEMRLYDDKRKKYQIGDEIVFENRLNGDLFRCKIVSIKVYQTFEELYKNYDKSDLGYLPNQKASYKDLEIYYPIEEQIKNKVCAIEVGEIKG